MHQSVAWLLSICLLHAAAQLSPSANRGMIIDAGSGGSRLHLFEWDARVFKTLPPAISYPSQRSHWTARLAPGLSSFTDDPSKVGEHLQPLIEFAKDTLKGREENFHTYPIYLKATGGMRQLPFKQREAIMTAVREYMNDKSQVPFYFEHDFARIISGEEEAIYAWTAINFLMGTLVRQLEGTGTVDANETYGALALGGASAQVGFFLPSQDISANMFKLQIGAQKHWNLYAHSFLWFGLTSARTRFHNKLAGTVSSSVVEGKKKGADPEIVNYCFPDGYEEMVEFDGNTVKLVAPQFTANDDDDDDKKKENKAVSDATGLKADDDVQGGEDDSIYNYDDLPPDGSEAVKLQRCREQTKPLLRLESNEWCLFAHGEGQCSYNGIYQPPLPEGDDFGHFVAITGYHYAWDFFGMPTTAPISEFAARAETVCSHSMKELTEYMQTSRNKLGDTKQAKEMLPYYCFMASFVLNQLIEGYGFRPDQEITVLDTYKGHKVSWALGAMLYEINTLPWEYAPKQTAVWEASVAWGGPLLIGLVLGAGLVAIFTRHQRKGYTPLRQQPEHHTSLTSITVHSDSTSYQASEDPTTFPSYGTA